jgi:hypothetical protein
VIAVLEDGTYDAIVFDVDDTAGGDTLVVELTVLAGPHKGEVVSLRTADWSGDALDLLGVPATLTVVGGEPSITFEP